MSARSGRMSGNTWLAVTRKVSSQSFYAYYPRWIEFRSALPMTATGKIQRYKLREEDVAAAIAERDRNSL